MPFRRKELVTRHPIGSETTIRQKLSTVESYGLDVDPFCAWYAFSNSNFKSLYEHSLICYPVVVQIWGSYAPIHGLGGVPSIAAVTSPRPACAALNLAKAATCASSLLVCCKSPRTRLVKAGNQIESIAVHGATKTLFREDGSVHRASDCLIHKETLITEIVAFNILREYESCALPGRQREFVIRVAGLPTSSLT